MKTNNISIILISELYQTKENHSPSFNVSFFHNDNVKNLGNIEVNENYETSRPKIYAGGDLAGVRGTVAWAAFSGREAAKKIVEKLKEEA